MFKLYVNGVSFVSFWKEVDLKNFLEVMLLDVICN